MVRGHELSDSILARFDKGMTMTKACRAGQVLYAGRPRSKFFLCLAS